MSAHRIGPYPFELWNGPPPPIEQEQIATHTRPGTDGVGAIQQGKWAQTVTVEVTSDFASFAAAGAQYVNYLSLVGADPVQVKWNNIEYAAAYGHHYRVDHVEKVSCRTPPRLLGPGYDFVGGARLICKFTLTAYVA